MIVKDINVYDGDLIHQRFAYKFFRNKTLPIGNILAFRAPMKVEADGMIDLEDTLDNDYIYSDDAINFFFRSLFAPVGTDLYKVKIDYPKERLLRLSDGLWSPGASSGTPNAPVAGAELSRPEKN